jgi:hypothetical protein
MTEAWIVAWPVARRSEKTAWDTEERAEWEAEQMVKSGRAEYAVVYRAEVEDGAA